MSIAYILVGIVLCVSASAPVVESRDVYLSSPFYILRSARFHDDLGETGGAGGQTLTYEDFPKGHRCYALYYLIRGYAYEDVNRYCEDELKKLRNMRAPEPQLQVPANARGKHYHQRSLYNYIIH